MAKAYNKGIRLRTFEKVELVLLIRRPMGIAHKSRGKFQPKWEGPFHSGDILLKWGLSVENNGRRCTYDARKWEVFEEILRMIVLTFVFFGIRDNDDDSQRDEL